MKAWHFSENAYPYLPPADEYESIRVSLPNRIYDPTKGAALYDRYIDEWLIAEDEGVEIMLNEHHQTATCVDPAAPLVLAALARLTKKARLLILGNPVANRRQPVRVAEEMAMVDVLSKGRLECGFVRGVPYEVLPANSNPVRMNERQWEAMDLIVKAWTNHDGPVSHEGRFFHHRNINIWPRRISSRIRRSGYPRPPGGAGRVGARGYVQATFLTGFGGTPAIYDSYRKGWREAGRGENVAIDRLAYAALVYAGESEREARAGAEKLLWYMTANKVPLHFCYPPGYVPTQVAAQILRGAAIDQHAANRANATVDKAIEAGIMFAGTPDQVFRQIKKMYDHVGGFGHLLIMARPGFLEHDETVRGIKTSRARSIHGSRRRFPTRRFRECAKSVWWRSPMSLTHETGLIAAPVPVYFETFAPAVPTGRPTVVMVHGGAHSGACYQRTADGRRGWAYRFAERGYRVVVPDWPGTGRSGYIALDKLDGATMVEGLGHLIRSLGAPVVLLTHSMSGLLRLAAPGVARRCRRDGGRRRAGAAGQYPEDRAGPCRKPQPISRPKRPGGACVWTRPRRSSPAAISWNASWWARVVIFRATGSTAMPRACTRSHPSSGSSGRTSTAASCG